MTAPDNMDAEKLCREIDVNAIAREVSGRIFDAFSFSSLHGPENLRARLSLAARQAAEKGALAGLRLALAACRVPSSGRTEEPHAMADRVETSAALPLTSFKFIRDSLEYQTMASETREERLAPLERFIDDCADQGAFGGRG